MMENEPEIDDVASPSEQQLIEVRRAAEAGREPGDAFDAAYAKQSGRSQGTADAVEGAVESAAAAAIEALEAGHGAHHPR
ncbi:hypothetical protein KDK95_33175 [Actinospica sp. MGRD01-02]|uniref:Uncharacterized protein n=1 Tax=Actinospica acidithermotolerans TaxID=2828514 RepID=A0A941IQ99_9ACTN|nr:hypothetical protein [Actinospica acidithermotolerans]MBR7831206.1 hypothetical protein [Actinospica acidithermotolerans]